VLGADGNEEQCDSSPHESPSSEFRGEGERWMPTDNGVESLTWNTEFVQKVQDDDARGCPDDGVKPFQVP
jgi:hypothetical protein